MRRQRSGSIISTASVAGLLLTVPLAGALAELLPREARNLVVEELLVLAQQKQTRIWKLCR